MQIRSVLFVVSSFFILSTAYAQNKIQKPANSVNVISWQNFGIYKTSDGRERQYLNFVGAQHQFNDGFLPRYSQKVAISQNCESLVAVITDPVYQPLNVSEEAVLKTYPTTSIGAEIKTSSFVSIAKKQKSGIVSFVPIRKNLNTNQYEKLISFNLKVTQKNSTRSASRSIRTYAANSVLQAGNWYKLAVPADGIYKISYDMFQRMGMDPATIDPRKIRVYGNGGAMLPEWNSSTYTDDLIENAIYVSGQEDGVFNTNDYVLFYAKGTTVWTYDSLACPNFKHNLNLYSDSSYYYVNADLGLGKRIQSQASSQASPTHNVTSFDDYAYHENDNVNFIKSGREWFGEYFDNIATYNFPFFFPNIDPTATVKVGANVASRQATGTGVYKVRVDTSSTTLTMSATPSDDFTPYAVEDFGCFSFKQSSPSVVVTITKETSSALGWLDYIDVNARRKLILAGSQMAFRDVKSVGPGNIAKYTVTSYSPLQIWDVSSASNVYSQALTVNGNNYEFVLPADTLKQFVAFDGSDFKVPSLAGAVANQNLHALSNKDFIIVTHPSFYQEASKLAAFHEENDSLSTIVLTPQQIYNEFSSGAQDISAIRNFMKMLYDKAGSNVSELPKYLLLFGDGSYDNKKRFSNNTNFIPTYQSYQSTIIINSYVSDDFYGLLDDDEGVWTASLNGDMVDVGIGRFPVKSKAEAAAAINKVFAYAKTGATNNSAFGDWRNVVCFIADDEDGGLHLNDANKLATMVDTAYINYNIDKIYMDAFPQESTPGGARYPLVTEAINKRMEKGCLIMNYTGHGGEVGLAHERIIDVATINKWSNINNMPLFFTATCEFSRFDDPARTSAGEEVFLNSKGAGIALFTTVRVVFASANFAINTSFYEQAFKPIDGKMPRLGDLFFYMKNQSGGNSENSRNFTLLGDPALALAYPRYNITTDTVNSRVVSDTSSDTLRALSLVTVSGFVRHKDGSVLNSYNGVLYPTVYDKSQSVTSLGNDETKKITFDVQKNVLYKGKTTVTNGFFKFSFVIPKDIAYKYGVGRISYYAENANEDAAGGYEKIIIGGLDTSMANDLSGPDLKLFMNDDKFVYGGLTNENPKLIALVKDDNGVNTVGNGIGHDIVAVLDDNTDNSIVLNDYYEADLDSYKSGSIRYSFSDLSEGKHTLKLKVWDVQNNSTQAYTEFIVAKSADLALSHVLNYPNPFTTKTQFFFEQNQCCQTLNVNVQIFTVSGKLVKTIDQYMQPEGFRVGPINWDGRDDFGDKIGKGVYIYRVKVSTSEGLTSEKFEKLVILN